MQKRVFHKAVISVDKQKFPQVIHKKIPNSHIGIKGIIETYQQLKKEMWISFIHAVYLWKSQK